MARLPNTPRPRWPPRSPAPASGRTDAVANRPPLPASRAGAMPTRAPLSERPARLRPPKGRPTKCAADPRHAQGAIAKARAAETRHPERATAAEACAAPGKAYPTAAPRKPDMPAKASAMAAKAAAVPTETSATAACIGFKREKRNEEEQYRGHA